MKRILMVGDVVSDHGRNVIRRLLPEFKRKNNIDIAIVNGENSAFGNGILPDAANELFDCGADIITTGNHVFKRREIYDYLDSASGIIRPANYPDAPGKGCYLYDGGAFTLLCINLQGVAFMEPIDNPFSVIDSILNENRASLTVVDFHGEATSEKRAMGFYLDGRVTAVVGTHTHVQTSDETILKNGTGYITDLGMTGPKNSVLGVVPQNVIAKLKTQLPTRFETADGEGVLEGVILDANEKNGKCENITRIRLFS